MHRRPLISAAASLFAATLASAALAEPAFDPEGPYRTGTVMTQPAPGSQYLTAHLGRIDGDRFAVSVAVTTIPAPDASGGCGGEVEGEITLEGRTASLIVENDHFDASIPESPVNARQCRIDMVWTGTPGEESFTLELTEQEGCLFYHGASCSFTGPLHYNAAG